MHLGVHLGRFGVDLGWTWRDLWEDLDVDLVASASPLGHLWADLGVNLVGLGGKLELYLSLFFTFVQIYFFNFIFSLLKKHRF